MAVTEATWGIVVTKVEVGGEWLRMSIPVIKVDSTLHPELLAMWDVQGRLRGYQPRGNGDG